MFLLSHFSCHQTSKNKKHSFIFTDTTATERKKFGSFTFILSLFCLINTRIGGAGDRQTDAACVWEEEKANGQQEWIFGMQNEIVF